MIIKTSKGRDIMSNQRPNIVFITSDECKATALGCYGNTDAYTPNIDRFSEEGMQFNYSFTTMPKCVPSRCAMMTGRYPHVEGHRTLPGFFIRKGENNLMLEMKNQGYKTGLFGKNHLVDWDIIGDCFDDYTREWKVVNRSEEDTVALKGSNEAALFRGMYRPPLLKKENVEDTYQTELAVNFIHKNKGNPFMLLLDIGCPHPAYRNIQPYIDIIRSRNIRLPRVQKLEDAPEVLRAYRKVYDLEMLEEDDWRRIVEAYYGMVSYADDMFSRVLKALDDAGISENTIVVFTADHGDFAGEHGCVEKWDTMFYDCLMHTPLIIRYPGRIRAGMKSDAMLENIDLAPTILELCGMEVPEWMHGKSLVKVIDGKTAVHKKCVFATGGVEEHAIPKALPYTDAHYTEHPQYYWKQRTMIDYPFSMARSKMVRTDKWKLVFRVDGTKELYDLENDPDELRNVSSDPKNAAIISELMEQLLMWAIRTETDYPAVKTMHA